MRLFRVLLALVALRGFTFAQAPVPALSPDELQQLLTSGQWAVVEFGGPTCVPCMKMQPILAELQAHFGNRVKVRNFYVTQHPTVARTHRVMAMPTQVVFDPSGKEVVRHIGFWPKADFLEALAKVGLK